MREWMAAARELWLPAAVTAGVAVGMLGVAASGNHLLDSGLRRHAAELELERDALRRELMRRPVAPAAPGGLPPADLIPPTKLPIRPEGGRP